MKGRLIKGLQVFFSVMIAAGIVSCKKEKLPVVPPPEPHPEMEYFDLANREIKPNAAGFAIDLNHDGRKDLNFYIQLVGDPAAQVDKRQYIVNSNIAANLPVNSAEEIPVMNSGDSIVTGNFQGYQWFEISAIVLVQKVISATAPDRWEGHWKNAVHKYLPCQVMVNDQRFNGWVELTVDTAGERIILHRAALSKEADKTVKAGR
ncbi:MAG: hypothetical protein HZA79_13080 [Sphingobacteriales bacterium]|nr:hypothetical protein [Sphingobacteriales bacterium]